MVPKKFLTFSERATNWPNEHISWPQCNRNFIESNSQEERYKSSKISFLDAFIEKFVDRFVWGGGGRGWGNFLSIYYQ